jgi:hypothetical protein
MNVFTKYTKRYFVLDLESATFTYADDLAKKPSCIIMLRVT